MVFIMFFKLLLCTSMLSLPLFLNAPLHAMEEETTQQNLQVVRYKDLNPETKRRLVKNAMRTTEEKLTAEGLALNLHTLYVNEFNNNFLEFTVFLKSPEMIRFLSKDQSLKLAFSAIAITRSEIFKARGDLSQEISESPLYTFLCKNFGDNLSKFQIILSETIQKEMHLHDAIKTKTKKPQAEELAQNLHSLYVNEFHNDLQKLLAFIGSEEFANFLTKHPHRRAKFNKIATQRSAKLNAREALCETVEIPESPLYNLLTQLFGEKLTRVQAALKQVITSTGIKEKNPLLISFPPNNDSI